MKAGACTVGAILLLAGCGGEDGASAPKSQPKNTPSAVASTARPQAGAPIPMEPGIMVDPAGAKWRYQEKAQAVTQSMQQQAGETDAYFRQ